MKAQRLTSETEPRKLSRTTREAMRQNPHSLAAYYELNPRMKPLGWRIEVASRPPRAPAGKSRSGSVSRSDDPGVTRPCHNCHKRR